MEGTDKNSTYSLVFKQVSSLIECESDIIANMANISALIKDSFRFLWVGFYIVKGEELVLGPFQGPVACTRIKKGKGVCGSAWNERQPIVVPDVEKFPGHIACSSLSRSEIVVPIFNDNEVISVLDIDSEKTGTFDNMDAEWLEKICRSI